VGLGGAYEGKGWDWAGIENFRRMMTEKGWGRFNTKKKRVVRQRGRWASLFRPEQERGTAAEDH